MAMLQYTHMDRKSSIMLFLLVIATMISIYFLYQRSYVTKDFEIINDNLDIDQSNS
jgi:hypothetical protein